MENDEKQWKIKRKTVKNNKSSEWKRRKTMKN